jgi:hypothetical protein
MADRVRYGGYDIVPEQGATGWTAWILHWDVPYGRVSGHGSVAAAVTAAQREIDRWMQRSRA